MKKIFYILFLFIISFTSTFAINDIKIITREEWGADESYRDINSEEWKSIMKKREENAIKESKKVYTQAQIDANKAKADRISEMNRLFINNYSDNIKIVSKITTEEGKTLAWPIEKTENINGIVIHHTSSDYVDSYQGIRSIYKYHSLTNQWGDIGYNYLIGKNGEIFEGRAGGDYVVAAHDKWNNRGNIGIALIGDYSENPINNIQYESLKNLSKYLIEKYNIDLTKKTYFHSECLGSKCDIPLTSELKDPIIGHRDAGHTDCPGDALYAQINDLKSELLKSGLTADIIYKNKIYKILAKISDEKLINILAKMEYELESKSSATKIKLKGIIIEYFNDKKNNSELSGINSNDKLIKIKLSYPNSDNISIRTGDIILDITRKGNEISVLGKKFTSLKIPKKDKDSILEITSWDRKPSWDLNGLYNDNKFRGDITLYVEDEQLVVINTLKIEDYLKGLGEVSDYETPEKIKTIITAARTYATWYTTKDRKFPGKIYDGSDDPEIFQKYLGYGLEERSPNIVKVVEETKGNLITYNGDIIKPWYFSKSDGKTLSYYEYCNLKYSDDICIKESVKYPYLQSVIDNGGKGQEKAGHGVGISGTGVSYFASKGWTYDMIIKYFLKGVDVL